MSGSEIVSLSEHFDIMEEVVVRRIRGQQPAEIARELGLERSQVNDLVQEWRVIMSNDEQAVSRSRDALANADRHYEDLIAKAWEVIEQADSVPDDPKYMAQKSSAIKLIGDLELKRFTMLKEMGALENDSLAESLAERERREEVLMEILKEVLCERCKPAVSQRLAQASGQVVVRPIPESGD